MNNFHKAIILSIIVHISLYLFLKNSAKEYKNEIKTAYDSKLKSQTKSSNIRYVQLMKKAKKKSKTKKKIVKKAKKHIKKSKPLKKPKLRNDTKISKKITKHKTKQKQSLSDFLSTPQKVDMSHVDEQTKQFIKLYGAEFQSYPQNIKQFLISNLSLIAQITQNYLEYPRLAIRLKLHGVNAIEFILHPNGDITQAKMILSSFHEILDDNTIETIKTAYKDYPRPPVPTLIRISVNYIYEY